MDQREDNVRLQVMICTHKAEGLRRVADMALPRIDGVGYLVSCQSDRLPLPNELDRDDVTVSFTNSVGLSDNRNNALSLVTAPYALIADDDLMFNADGLQKVIEKFDTNDTLDIATFMCEYPYPKVYPDSEMDLRDSYKNYNVTSFEIAVRTSSIRCIGARFSPLMGIGAPYLHAGEESTFVLSCLRQGLRGRFYPILIASHAHETTGIYGASRPGVLRANGAYTILRHPYTAPLRLPLIAYRTPGNIISNLAHLVAGAIYGLRHRQQLLYP